MRCSAGPPLRKIVQQIGRWYERLKVGLKGGPRAERLRPILGELVAVFSDARPA
jgi:hypothetical protein